MPQNKTVVIRHTFNACVGFATDLGPTVDVTPDQSGKVQIPFLLEAQDTAFELDGGPHKIGGTTKVNASAVASGGVVTGLYDFWKQGTAGNPSRRRVLHAGTTILADADDASFVNTLFTGLTGGAVPSYSVFNDLLLLSSDSTVDVPRSWDQTIAQNLAGTPPRFSFSATHKNRSWAAGDWTHPSRLYYSANVNPEDWVGVGSGSIDIDLSDGDMITGIASHQDKLFVFKGPNKGSIHMITGSSPTGSDAFARTTFVRGLGAAWQNSIFRFGDDLGFVSQYGTVHSMSATQAYGDFEGAALSRQFNSWLRDHLNYNRLRYIATATDPLAGLVYFSFSIDSSSTNNCVFVMDYRGAPNIIRWSRVPSYKMASLNLFVDTSGLRRVLGGGNDGYVRRLNIADRSIDNATALSFDVRTPYFNYGAPITTKTLSIAAAGIAPKGSYNGTFGWTRDNNAQQTQTFAQSGADVLGAATSAQFTLDTSALGGAQFVDRFMDLETGGEFRSIQYEFTQSGLNQDIELHAISVAVTPGAMSTEATI